MIIHNKRKVMSAARTLAKESSLFNPVEIVTPRNFAELSDEKSFTPTFEYDTEYLENIVSKKQPIIDAANCIFDNCAPEAKADEIIMDIIQVRVDDILASIGMAEGILGKDDAETFVYARSKYGMPPSYVTAEAENRAKGGMYRFDASARGSIVSKATMLKLMDLSMDAKQVSEIFRQAMCYLEMAPWRMIITENCAAIDVRDRSSEGDSIIFIPAKKPRKGDDLLSLAAHEIYGHAFSSNNARVFFDNILRDTPLSPLTLLLAKTDHEVLYEGVAKTYDVAVKGEKSLPQPWATTAIKYARCGDNFTQVAEAIMEMRKKSGVSEERARASSWTTAYRIFRGSTNPTDNKESRYVFPKDAAYFWGYKKAQEYKNQPIFALYSSMKIEEIKRLSKAFPAMNAIPQQFDLERFVNHMIDCMLG